MMQVFLKMPGQKEQIMLLKSLQIIAVCVILSFLSLIFRGFELYHFINALFMISVLVFCYGFFKLMNERRIFRSFQYSSHMIRSFFNSFMGDKNAYVERVEKEALKAAGQLNPEEEREEKCNTKSTFEKIMLEEVKKDEWTISYLFSGIVMALVSTVMAFHFFFPFAF